MAPRGPYKTQTPGHTSMAELQRGTNHNAPLARASATPTSRFGNRIRLRAMPALLVDWMKPCALGHVTHRERKHETDLRSDSPFRGSTRRARSHRSPVMTPEYGSLPERQFMHGGGIPTAPLRPLAADRDREGSGHAPQTRRSGLRRFPCPTTAPLHRGRGGPPSRTGGAPEQRSTLASFAPSSSSPTNETRGTES